MHVTPLMGDCPGESKPRKRLFLADGNNRSGVAVPAEDRHAVFDGKFVDIVSGFLNQQDGASRSALKNAGVFGISDCRTDHLFSPVQPAFVDQFEYLVQRLILEVLLVDFGEDRRGKIACDHRNGLIVDVAKTL